MKTVTVNIANVDEFFRQGRLIAQLADQQKTLPSESTISFEDLGELLALLTPARLTLLRTITEHSGSIASIAERLCQAPEAIQHDIEELRKIGLIAVESQGVHLTADRFQLETEVTQARNQT